jgi:hypothetical protein
MFVSYNRYHISMKKSGKSELIMLFMFMAIIGIMVLVRIYLH